MKLARISAFVGLLLGLSVAADAQNSPTPALRSRPDSPGAYPNDRAGVFVQNPDWSDLPNAVPSKTKTKHSIAASLSYGVVPAIVIAEYEGEHAKVQVKSAQPLICLCHLLSLPGDPVIVRLHLKKKSRELDGGNMIVYPIVGGAKTADAKVSDLIAVDVSHPDPSVWLVQPKSELEAGEYALMLGTTNMNIFPFTITVGRSDEAFDK